MNSERRQKQQNSKSLFFDFIFAVNGLPIDGSGGAKIVAAIVNGLHGRGYRVGILVMPRWDWNKVLDPYFTGYSIPSRLVLWLNDTPWLHRFLYPVLRRTRKGIPSCSFDRGVKIFRAGTGNTGAKFYIATNFLSAVMLKSTNVEENRIVLFSQIDETQPLYSHQYSSVASEIYRNLERKIFINREVADRYPPAEVIPMAIDLRLFARTVPINSRSPKNVVFILRGGKQKDPDTALGAMHHLYNEIPGIEISAFGNIPKERVPKYVNYHFRPDNGNMVKLLNMNRIFVITSRLEGYPAPPLEAMACGCAVVATDSVGIREYLRSGENGIMVPPGDEESIFEAVKALLNNEEKLIVISEEGYRTAQEHGYARMIDRFIQACNDLHVR